METQQDSTSTEDTHMSKDTELEINLVTSLFSLTIITLLLILILGICDGSIIPIYNR